MSFSTSLCTLWGIQHGLSADLLLSTHHLTDFFAPRVNFKANSFSLSNLLFFFSPSISSAKVGHLMNDRIGWCLVLMSIQSWPPPPSLIGMKCFGHRCLHACSHSWSTLFCRFSVILVHRICVLLVSATQVKLNPWYTANFSYSSFQMFLANVLCWYTCATPCMSASWGIRILVQHFVYLSQQTAALMCVNVSLWWAAVLIHTFEHTR